MSAEYAARMEVLQRRREELTAQRQAVEKRMALREATAAEFSAVALQSCRQKWKTQRNAALAAQKRNDQLVRSLREAQRQVHDACARLQGDQSRCGALLAQEKARYNRRVEQVFPAWQEQLQRQRVLRLRELEDKKRAVERRRYLAKKSFEKEQTLDDLIRKTRHEVKMAENLEQNELYERELLRTQSTNQAKEVDQSIREVALEARSYLQQQAAKHLEVMPELDEELAEKLSETFSPRNTLRALREGSSSFAFEENQQYEEEKPARQIRVEIPARMNSATRPYFPDVNQQNPNQAFYYTDDAFQDDYVADEIIHEFDGRPAHPNPTSTERHQAPTTTHSRNEYTMFEQSSQPGLMASYNQPIATASSSFGTTSGMSVSQTTSDSRNEHQLAASPSIPIPIARHNDTTRERIEVLPTLVTGKLEPIPEANEKIALGGASTLIPSKASVSDPVVNRLLGNEFGGASGAASFTKLNPHISSATMPTSAPTKIEENRKASTPATPYITVATVDESFQTRAETEPPAAPEPSNNDIPVVPQEQPAPNVLESIEILKASFSMAEDTTNIPDEASLQESQDKLATQGEPGNDPTANDTFSLDDKGDTLPSVTSVITPVQPESQSDVTTDGALSSKCSLETKEAPTIAMDFSRTIEVVPRASLVSEIEDDHEVEEGPSHDKMDRMDSPDTVETNLSITTTAPMLDTLENPPPKEAESSVDRELPTEVPESSPSASIVYTTDLLEPFSPVASTPVNAQRTENDMLLTSMQSDDFDLSANSMKPVAEVEETKPSIPPIEDKLKTPGATGVVDSPAIHASTPETPAPAELEETSTVSITERLSPADRVKALAALISRVEEGATEGDTLGGSTDTGSSHESKRELLKMAVGGRKAQIAFFGSDICFELILDLSRDLGPVLFPPKAFEGIMNDQKVRKLHQSNKEKQLDLWKALSGHLKQIVQLKAIPSATVVDLFVAAFLAHDPDNQRSQRKLREFLGTVCGGGGSGSRTPSPRKEASLSSSPPSPPKQEQRSSSPEPAKADEPEDRIGTPQLLQTAFLQRQSPPKPKVFGIASSSSFKDRSSGSSDVLASMSAGPMKLSQKLMRGGKMNDYSEFEEEEEVDLQNLIGTKSAFSSGASSSYSARGGSHQAAKTPPTGKSAAKKAAAVEEEDEFDADF